MAASQALGEELSEQVGRAKVLVVGTGGIGCELLKNLVLTGFKDIVAVSCVLNSAHWVAIGDFPLVLC